MDLYDKTARSLSKQLTLAYSTSFGLASRLFSSSIRDDIYAIYGLVRIADEIVDVYRGKDAERLLVELEKETMAAIERQYSANPIVHSFARVAKQYAIDASLIRPFFASMHMDINPKQHYTEQEYTKYVYGSAEVVGLMCLRVFTLEKTGLYDELKEGAQRLGAAYQKVNFLRDYAVDSKQLGRVYFPNVRTDMTEAQKGAILDDIKLDFDEANIYISQLPPEARRAVRVSYEYYRALLDELEGVSVSELTHIRVRVSNWKKLWLMAYTIAKDAFSNLRMSRA